MASFHLRYLLWRALSDDITALLATFGSQVDDPIGGADHIQVVLDDDHRVASIGQAVEYIQQALDIGEVQAGGGLIQDVNCLSRSHAAQFFRQLDALGLAAAQS